jgi:hypothetical protein
MLSAFTSLLDAGTPLANPPALRLPVGRRQPEPTPEPPEKPLMPMPFGLCDSGARSSLVSRTARGSQ